MARTRAAAKKHLPAIASPSGVVPAGPAGAALLAEIRELIDDRDVKKIMATLRGALDAEQNVRAPRSVLGKNDYERVPDWSARLTAARVLLSYRFGNAPTHAEVHVHSSGDAPSAGATPDDLFREMIESGADVPGIMASWLNAMKRAEPSPAAVDQPQNPENPPKIAQIPEKAEVFEV